MSQSYILLTLDTTAPDVELLLPNFTTNQARTEIRVVANESLLPWHEIYVIDSLGRRHNLTFKHEDDEFVGVVVFSDYPMGIATVYATVKDSVGNQSALVSKSIRIVESETLSITLDDYNAYNVLIKSENAHDVIVKDDELIELRIDVKDEPTHSVSLKDEKRFIVTVDSKEV